MDEAGYLRGVCRSAERNEMRKPEDYRGIELWSFFYLFNLHKGKRGKEKYKEKERDFALLVNIFLWIVVLFSENKVFS